MPTQVHLELHVARDKQNKQWEHTTPSASPGTIYAYRYTPDGGHVRQEIGDEVEVTLTLKPQGKGDYAIVGISVPVDPHGQLGDRRVVDPHHAIIRNINKEIQEAYFCVMVTHDGGPAFECDPMIANLPRNLP